jgi:hypothetical protein
MRLMISAAILAGATCVGAGSALAGGSPFYGYSNYFGGPTTYFTRENDVQQATTIHGDGPDIRTYYRGGPFWTYAPARASLHAPRQRRVVLRRKG